MTVPLTILQQETISGLGADWASTVPFNQFDPADGDLLDAAFTTMGTIDASASIENLAPVAATVNLGVTASIVATAPDIGAVAQVTPIVAASVTVAPLAGAFDGTLDFGGPSGTILPDLAGSASQTTVIQTGSVGNLPFVGPGTFDVGVSSYATSTVNGNGNLAVLLHSTVGAVVSLQYDATSPSPGAGDGDGVFTWGGTTLIAIPFVPFGNFTTTTPQVVALPSQTSGWSSSAAFHQFDPSLGTLVAIELNVGNTIAGSFSAANLESVPAGVSMTETASMVATTPGFATGVTATAAAADSLSLAASDGTDDFMGPSGRSDIIYGPLRLYDPGLVNWPGTLSLSDASDLAAFTGTGTIDLPVSTAGTSTVTGPSNLLSEITQHTGGTVSVSYVYATPSVTEEFAASGPMAAAHVSALGSIDAYMLNPPEMTFIGALQNGITVSAQAHETFVIGAGANATISDFAPVSGEQLNLTYALAGAVLQSDLSNLGAFVSVTAQQQNPNGGTDTTLALNGSGGKTTLTLVTAGPIAVADLLNDNALILPPH